MYSSNQQQSRTCFNTQRQHHVTVVSVSVLLCLLLSALRLAAAPVLVTYGRDARPGEGDDDYTQVIYFSISEGSTERLYLRAFDPEITEAYDLIYGIPDTQTQFTLYGGAQAYTAATARTKLPSPADLTAGRQILQRRFGVEASAGDRWRTLGSFAPTEGELVDQLRVFKLVVEGLAGNDGNRYDVAVSTHHADNAAPKGLRLFTYAPTVRVTSGSAVVEMPFDLPPQTEALEIHNFDAANGRVTLETLFRSVPAVVSGFDEWRTGKAQIYDRERGEPAAVTFSGGSERPNDASFYVTNQSGDVLPINLPILVRSVHGEALEGEQVTLLSDCLSVAFDASRVWDHDSDTLRYLWDFGDGTQGQGVTSVHRYRLPGSYLTTLTVIDNARQAGKKARKTMGVALPQPPTAVAGPGRTVASGQRIVFDGSASKSGHGAIVDYTWGFGDGTVANGRRISHVFEQPGEYLVTLRVTNDAKTRCNTSHDQVAFRVNAAPVAEAGNNIIASIGDPVTLDAGLSYDTDGKLLSYLWDLGDGTLPKEGQVVEHVYHQPGRYKVSLTVRDDAGVSNSMASDTLTAVITYPPLAQAEADRKVAMGEVIEFDGRTSKAAMGEFADYFWDFGDGAQAQGINVVYAYKKPGRYRTILTVRDKSSLRSVVSSDALVIFVNEPPVADAGEDQFVTTNDVHFDGTASSDADGHIASYAWSFGDGATSSEPNPIHVYRKPGVYTVRLTVTDDSGTLRNTSTDTLKVVLNSAPIADAGADQTGEPEQQLIFDASGSIDPDGSRMAFFWDFGDGHTASGVRVAHRYAKAGMYTVSLTAKDDAGGGAFIGYDEANVTINAAPIADAGHDILAAPGDVVTLSAVHSYDLDGKMVSYQWQFSDSDDVLEQMESRRQYHTPGVYTARVMVTDDSGASNATAQDEVMIHINHPPKAVPGRDMKTQKHTVTFDASDSVDPDGHALTYTWDLGDGTPSKQGVKIIHTYVMGGVYPVVLTVDDGTGLSNAKDTASMTVTIDRPPLAVAGPDQTVCTQDIVVFDGSNSRDPEGGLLHYLWTFGDGVEAEGVNPTHIYRKAGVYPVTLSVQDDSGFPENSHRDRLTVKVDEAPVAVAGPDQSVCAHTQVFFDGSASRDADGTVNRFIWDFGDNSRPKEGARISHTYIEPGTYRVTLTIIGDQIGQCDDSDTDELMVTVAEAPLAHVAAPDLVSVEALITFKVSVDSRVLFPVTSWQWDFGDGTSGQGETVTHAYAEPGRYKVQLRAATQDDISACAIATAHKLVTVNSRPKAVAAVDTRVVGLNEEVLLDASGSRDLDGSITTYTWDLGDGTLASGMQVRHRYQTSGTFPVVLTVEDNTALDGNSATDTLEITVNSTPQPKIVVQEQACVGETVKFSGIESLDADGEIARYEWDFGDGETGRGATVSHAYERPGRYQMTLVVDDGTALSNSKHAATKIVTVNQPPRPNAGPPRLVCPHTDVTFDGTTSVDVDGRITHHEWGFDDGMTVAGGTVTRVFDVPGTYRATLSVTDDSGSRCSQAEDHILITVNAQPSASIQTERTVWVGGAYDVAIFDATQSVDPDREPLTYQWNFGDGTIKTGAKVLHTYAHPGQYKVKLRVRDGSRLPCGEAWSEVVLEARARRLSEHD